MNSELKVFNSESFNSVVIVEKAQVQRYNREILLKLIKKLQFLCKSIFDEISIKQCNMGRQRSQKPSKINLLLIPHGEMRYYSTSQ